MIEKDYVDVLDESETNKEEKPILSKGLDLKNEIEDAPNEKEALKLSENKTEDVKVEENEDGLYKSMTGIVSDLKNLAKLVVDSVNESKKHLDEITAVKKEMVASLEEVKELVKSVPLRKSSIPVIDEVARKDEQEDVFSLLKKTVKNYENLPPQEKLRHYLKFQANQ